jgi:hypothetical protein
MIRHFEQVLGATEVAIRWRQRRPVHLVTSRSR